MTVPTDMLMQLVKAAARIPCLKTTINTQQDTRHKQHICLRY